MLCGSISAIAQSADELMIEPAVATAGKAVTTYLYLNNPSTADEVRNMQFDIQWPAGWTVAKVSIATKKVNDRFNDETYVFDEEKDEDVLTYVPYFQASSGNPTSNNVVTYVYNSSDARGMKGNSGYIGSVRVTPPAGTPDGVYPVYLKAGETFMATSEKPADRLDFADATSYIVVGTPSKAELKVLGTLPSFVNTKLATELGVAKVDLSEATAVNGDFTYVDGRDVVGTAATASVKYVGNKAEKEYYSVNVPFDGAVTGNVYELSEVTGEFAIFNEATSVVAGKTYLAEGAVTLAANAAVAGVATETGKEGSYVLDGQFWHGKNLTVPATRGLFDVPAGSNLRVVIDGVLTNITTAQIEAGETSYDLQGRQVQNAKNGVFVVNGKKQFVK